MINTSGIHPSGFRVLIEPKALSDTFEGTSILRPDQVAEKQKYATTQGTIIEIGGAAFTHITEAEWDGEQPKPGDRVIFTKYGGMEIDAKDSADGKRYLLIKGEDVHAVIEEAKERESK